MSAAAELIFNGFINTYVEKCFLYDRFKIEINNNILFTTIII